MYTNADQFINKRDDLQLFIAGDEPDIIIITEILPKAPSFVSDALLSLPGYTSYFNFNCGSVQSSSTRQRGVGIYITDTLSATRITFPSEFEEHLWISLKLRGSDVLTVGCIYRSPSSSVDTNTKLLCDLLRMSVTTSHYLLCGDFNYPNIDWSNLTSNSAILVDFIDTTQDLFLHQHISEPTRYRGNQTPNVLDLVFTNEEGMVSDVSYLPGLGSSDHICIRFNLNCYSERSNDKLPRLNMHKADYVKMRELLNAVNWEESIGSLEITEAWNLFSTTLDSAIDACIPTFCPSTKKNLYMTKEALHQKNVKNRLWRQYLQTRLSRDYTLFTKARNNLRSLTRKLRRNFEKSIVTNIKQNPKSFWKYANSRLKTKAKIQDIHEPNGNKITSNSLKAYAFGEFFSSVFISEDTTSLPSFTLTNSPPDISDIDISPQSVLEKLKSLKVDKSPGPDGWPPAVLRELSDVICVPLAIIYRKSLQSGTLPESWRIGHVVPIHKSGSQHNVANYRPISLTSVTCKVLESLIRDHILTHLLNNNLLSPHQHGFIPNRSCNTQLVSVIDKWTSSIQSGIPIDVIYFDFRKAFDTVPHSRLLLKLEAYGITGNLLDWIQSFLVQRKQRVVINGEFSPWSSVKSGVPQGSVLGPLLFAIYVNDLPTIVKSSLVLFADDTKLFRCIKSLYDVKELQKDIDALYCWSKQWLLSFNITKCKVLRIGTHQYLISYKLNGTTIENVDCIRDLGIQMDTQLKFHQQTSKVVQKANGVLSLINKSFEYITKDTLPVLYKALVRPIIEYGNIVWGPFFNQDIKRIESIQRRATRIVPSLAALPYVERLKSLKLPSLQYRRNRGDMIFAYQLLHNQLDMDTTLLHLATFTTTRGHNFKLQKPFSSILSRRNCFSVRVINNWNNLPYHVVNSDSVNTFKNRLDNYWHNNMYDL